MGRSHFSFGGERKVCKRKPAARRLQRRPAPLRGGGFGYRGGALEYGRRHGGGGAVLAVVRFPRGAQGAARHGVCSGLAAALSGGLCGTPVQTVAAGPDQKDSARPAAQRTRFMQEKRKKAEKCVAKQAHNII